MRTQGGAAAGGATPPTADSGADQQQVGLGTVTLNGSGSTAGATMAWALRDPAQQNQDALLSSTSVISPTFDPTYTGLAGDWTATLAVTKDGLTSYDSTNIRIGDTSGWITLLPADSDSTYASGNYSTVTWGASGDWATLTLGPKSGTINSCDDCEIQWYALDVDWEDITGLEVVIEADESYTQPVELDKFYAGAMFGTTTVPGATYVGVHTVFWLANKAEDTALSMRTNNQSFSFGMKTSGFNGASAHYSKQLYDDTLIRRVYQKLDTVTPANNTPADSACAIAPVGSNPVQVGMICGRAGTTLGDITMKFAVRIRVQKR